MKRSPFYCQGLVAFVTAEDNHHQFSLTVPTAQKPIANFRETNFLFPWKKPPRHGYKGHEWNQVFHILVLLRFYYGSSIAGNAPMDKNLPGPPSYFPLTIWFIHLFFCLALPAAGWCLLIKIFINTDGPATNQPGRRAQEQFDWLTGPEHATHQWKTRIWELQPQAQNQTIKSHSINSTRMKYNWNESKYTHF